MFVRLTLLFFITLAAFGATAQDSASMPTTPLPSKPKKNVLKANVIGIALSGQYERLLSKRVAVGFSYKTIPWGGVPFRGLINPNNQGTQETLNKLRFHHQALTPEIRFYFGKKGYGNGFYVAPFYRNATFRTSGLGLDFVKDNGQEDTLRFDARINTHTYGMLLGSQWNLGKRFVLDIQFFGPHFGRSNLSIIARPKFDMTPDEQDNLEALGQLFAEEAKNSLTSAGIPFKNETVLKEPEKISLKANSIWAGIRTGISIGWRF